MSFCLSMMKVSGISVMPSFLVPFWLQCVQNVFNSWTQMCLSNNNMCMGSIKHILIGHLGKYEKRNATLLLYNLHLRLVVDSMLRVKTQFID
jgi:hypothetical protein